MQISDLPKQADYYIPHRAPMLLLDELVAATDNGCTAKVVIRADMPFIEENEGLPSWVGIEIMAQTVSMFGGFQERLQGKAPKLGFLLGSKKFFSGQDFFLVGQELTIEIKLQFLNKHKIGMFECKITTASGETTAILLASQPDNPEEILPLVKAS